MIYDTSFLRRDSGPRERHGLLWTTAELARLVDLFWTCHNLQQLCEQLQRPAAGVLAKLTQMRLLTYETHTNSYSFSTRPQRNLSSLNPSTIKEETMSTNQPIIITEQTLVNGTDIKQMSDHDLYALIANQEAFIEKLSKIKAQPQRLKDDIAKRQKALGDLVALIDRQ